MLSKCDSSLLSLFLIAAHINAPASRRPQRQLPVCVLRVAQIYAPAAHWTHMYSRNPTFPSSPSPSSANDDSSFELLPSSPLPMSISGACSLGAYGTFGTIFFSTLMPMLVGWRYGRVGARGFRFEFRPVVSEHSIRLVCGS